MLKNRRTFLLEGAAVLTASRAFAQNSFLTPGGASVPGIVTMCITGNVAAPCGGGAAFPPQVGGVNPTLYANFAGNQYWAAGVVQPSFAAWMTAIGGTYTRASTATYLQAGVVQTAAANVARFPTNLGGTPTGIRLTGAATNLLIYSQGNFVSQWTKQNAGDALVDNVGTAPDGTSTASSLTQDTATATHGVFLAGAVSFTSGQNYTLSFFAKLKGGVPILQVYPAIAAGGSGYGIFDLTAGTAISVAGTSSAVASISALANGWYLCTVTFTSVATTSGAVFFNVVDTTGAVINAATLGDGVRAIFIWGAQITATAFQADYIPTTTATVTQAADSFSFPFTQQTYSGLVNTNGLLYDGTNIQRVLADNNIAGIWITAATVFAAWSASSIVTGPSTTNVINPHKTMIAGNTGNTSITSDGLTPASFAQGINAAVPTAMGLGIYAGGSNGYASGNYSQLGIWNGIVASNADLIRLTQ
jgi:hypothetical protein